MCVCVCVCVCVRAHCSPFFSVAENKVQMLCSGVTGALLPVSDTTMLQLLLCHTFTTCDICFPSCGDS